MKGRARKASALVAVFIVMLVAGCEPQEPPSVRQSRAIAAENIELRKQVEQLNRKIERLKEQYEKETKKQEKLLAQCQQDKESWKRRPNRTSEARWSPSWTR